MSYKIIISPKAQKEIENAIDYYSLYSTQAPSKFVEKLAIAYSQLSTNPFLEIRYKNIRSLKIDIFPYSLFFDVNEKANQVKIISCFHNKLNPTKRP